MINKIKSVISDSSIILVIMLTLNIIMMTFKVDIDTAVNVIVVLYCLIIDTMHNYLVSHDKKGSKLDKTLYIATILGVIAYIIFVVYRTWIY